MTYGLAVVIIGIALGWPCRAHGEATVKEIIKVYDEGSADRSDILLALSQTENGLGWANAFLSTRSLNRLYCPPGNLAMTGEQILDMLRRAANEDLTLGDAPYGLAILRTMAKTFPC